MARRKAVPAQQPPLLQVATKTAPCVPSIRLAVQEWRQGGRYPGVTETTRTLLHHWFHTDHRLPNGRRFRYHDSQREAVETLVYLYEVAGVRRFRELAVKYAAGGENLRLLQHDDFARYCVKMATGSGKTKVMALAIAWQFFNAVAEARDDFAKTSLIIAPNVIVFERLKADFAGGRIFRTDPVIPKELEIYWDMDCYLRGEGERASSSGAVYLTNVQQFYQRPDKTAALEPEPMTAVMGYNPRGGVGEVEDFDKRIAARGGPCLVVNDEAHHTHDEDSEWNRVIRRLHGDVPGGLAAQLDFTATPRHSKGSLFSWTVFDYPLKQAILDGIVKRPMVGVAKSIGEAPSETASVRYSAYLTAGVERWREYRQQLAPLKKKPVLFVMLNSTREADEVADSLRARYPEDFAGDRLRVIHTDLAGDVSKRELDEARKVVREVDREENPVNAIVSVLMLREGWDVQNVTVVVGLRPYSAKANILPEQTIGRGLRLMFRDWSNRPSYVERVDVIGNDGFLDFVRKLEEDEEMELPTFDLTGEPLVIVTIHPNLDKVDKDITLPVLSPILTRKKSLADEIAALDVGALECPVLPLTKGDGAAERFHYEAHDILTLETMVERDYTLPEVQTSQEVVAYYAQRIAQEVRLPSQFAALAPKVREFLRTRAFGREVGLEARDTIRAMSTNVAHYVTVSTFVKALRPLVVQELEPQLLHPGRRLSETMPFPFSRATIPAGKTVFNLVACDNEYERRFAAFLEAAADVEAFAKLPEQFGFSIEYTDTLLRLRYYEPDFVAVLADGSRCLIETKGREDVDVAHKDQAAVLWCENATRLTGTEWRYLKASQTEFEQLRPSTLAQLLAVAAP